MEETNFLIPKHRILSEEEVKILLEKHNLSSTEKFPKIKLKDPAVISLGVNVGDVIEITRDKSFVGESKYYRVVIDNK